MDSNQYTEPYGFHDALCAHAATSGQTSPSWPKVAAGIATVISMEVAQWLL